MGIESNLNNNTTEMDITMGMVMEIKMEILIQIKMNHSDDGKVENEWLKSRYK